ncbi:MAG: LysR family transcriptional regulator, partial [Clostridium sp.]
QANVGVFDFDINRREEIKSQLSHQNLEYHFLCHVKPHIVLSENHPLIREHMPVNLNTLTPYGFVRYFGQCEDFTYRIFSENSQYNLNYGSRIVYLDGRASLLHLISNSDFYSIGIHDFSAQATTYKVVSIPIEGCSDMLEFGYILPSGTPVSPITKEFLEGLTKRLST